MCTNTDNMNSFINWLKKLMKPKAPAPKVKFIEDFHVENYKYIVYINKDGELIYQDANHVMVIDGARDCHLELKQELNVDPSINVLAFTGKLRIETE